MDTTYFSRLVLFCAVVAVSGTRDPATALEVGARATVMAQIARNYSGSFVWDQNPERHKVSMCFITIKPARDGDIVAIGRGRYVQGNVHTRIRIEAMIDPHTRKIEIKESNPDQKNFITHGSHIGFFSTDFRTIAATWTTVDTDRTGTLVLQAVTHCDAQTMW